MLTGIFIGIGICVAVGLALVGYVMWRVSRDWHW